MMCASFLIMAGAGATYLFGVYSKTINSTLGYDQSTLNLIGTFKDLGANVGVLSGLLAEVTPTWFVLLVGSVMNFAGYFLIWLAVTKKIATPKVWQMCIYICVGANSQNFANTGSLVTCVKNFPESRGMMLGLMKGYVGLSGAIFTQLYLAIYGNDSKSLILLIGWLPAVLSIIFIPNIRVMKCSRHPNEVKVYNYNLVISILLALLLMGITIAQKYIDFSHVAYVACATIVCVVLFFPCIVAIREEWSCWKLKMEEFLKSTPSRVIVEEPPLPELKPAAGGGQPVELPEYSSMVEQTQEEKKKKKEVGCFSDIFEKPKRGEDYTILQALLSLDMLILFVATFCGLGCSLTAIDNLGQIVYVASLLIGFSFGIQLTLLFIIISELFGLKYYSTLFNCGQLASPLGSYIMNVKIVGNLYDNEALKQLASKGLTRSMVKELICIGKQCYRNSFIILACANLFGALVSLILVMRTKDYYKSDIYKRFRDEMEANEKEMKIVSAAGKKEHCEIQE
ncbi:hypothetical protein HAX54_038659 [Datura stramonium]|uniref:Nodulin-like domain-containing protein n=1 Tax=Datura stramonium TaxID=4076 RepID=A0ABS8SIN5_DATST|nr:hypothetical protein [Datura stramonium]